MKTNGQKITVSEFDALKRGDLYWITDLDEGRVFERFAKCCSFKKNPSRKAVNSDGTVNALGDMRWMSAREFQERVDSAARSVAAGRAKSNASYKEEAKQAADTNSDWSCVKSTKKVENNSMSSKSVVCEALAVVKSDVSDAAWRTAARQTIRSARTPVTAFLDKQNLPKGVVGMVLSQLDTENGEAVMALLLGTAMSYVPQFSQDEKLSRLAKELRVMGYDNFVGKVAEAILGPLREGLVDIVKTLAL